MKPYHKIPTVFKRDPETNYKTLLLGKYATPELEYLKDCEWVFTEKVDGTNIRIMSYPEGTVGFGGRTDHANIPAKLVNRLSELFPPHAKLYEQFPGGACLYGEGFGAGIQKGGRNYGNDQDFVLFDVQVGDWWLKREDVCDIAMQLGLEVVPVLGQGNLAFISMEVEAGIQSKWGDFLAEGIVARPEVELSGRNNERVICKLKYKDFV